MTAGIYEPSEMCTPDDMADPTKMMQNCIVNVCQPGSGLLAAGYCLYSSSVIFMLSIGNGCHGFTYDSLVGEFILTHPDLKVRAFVVANIYLLFWHKFKPLIIWVCQSIPSNYNYFGKGKLAK